MLVVEAKWRWEWSTLFSSPETSRLFHSSGRRKREVPNLTGSIDFLCIFIPDIVVQCTVWVFWVGAPARHYVRRNFWVGGDRIKKKGFRILSRFFWSNWSIFGTHPENQKNPTQYVRRVGTPTPKPILYTVQQCHVWKCIENASRWNLWHHFSFCASLRVEEPTSLGTRKKGPPFPPSSGFNHEHYLS